jgi:hypothetical protein
LVGLTSGSSRWWHPLAGLARWLSSVYASRMAKGPRKALPEVPRAVFEKFLGELGKDTALADVVARLKPVLLDDDRPTEAAIKAALLPDDADGPSL